MSLAPDRDGIFAIGAAGGTRQLVMPNASAAAISPDGTTLAFLRDEERADMVGTAALWISSPVGAPPRKYEGLGEMRFIEGALSFSPDGTATTGSLYLRSRDGTRFAIRVLGVTARVRIERFVPARNDWVEGF